MSLNDNPQRKKIRLSAENYVGHRAYFVTICCHNRRPLFRKEGRARRLFDQLGELAERHCFLVHAYCIMPNHFHLLVEGTAAQSDLRRFIHQLKQESSYEEKTRTGLQLWQRYFYDHILRPRDSMIGVAWYIWMNPVRQGLCREPERYAFSGSFTTDWKRKSHPATPWSPPWKQASL